MEEIRSVPLSQSTIDAQKKRLENRRTSEEIAKDLLKRRRLRKR